MRQDSPGSIDARAGGASVVQVETLGKQGMIVMLVMFIVIVVIGILAGYSLGVGEARAEDMDAKLRRMDSRVSVLEYDAKGLCGQLLAKEIVEVCH